MSYESLSPRQAEILNLLMSGEREVGMTHGEWLGKRMGISESTAKKYLMQVSRKYGIPMKTGPYLPTLRLVYMRAKELGMV